MNADARTFLDRLLTTPSVSGYEQPIQQAFREYAGAFADEVHTDVHGNAAAVLNPDGQPRIMLAAHCDQIGFIVQHIDSNGYLAFSAVGGHDNAVLVGQPVVVWTKEGAVNGVIGRKAVHLLSASERGKAPSIEKLWIDIGAKDKEEAESVAALGDPVTFRLGVTELRNNRIASPALDNKAGVWAMTEAARMLAETRDFDAAVFAVSTVQEELGVRGAETSAYTVHPHVGIAVDVNHATDTPDAEKKKIGHTVVGGGPVIVRGPNVNPRVFEIAVQAAQKAEIPVQIAAYPSATPTDARALQLARGGTAAGLFKIPNRYMHTTVEVVSLEDMEQTAALFAEFIRAVSSDTDFTP